MKKIICSLLLLLTCIVTEAKVITITLTDGSTKVFTSSELSAIDFNDDGTLTVTTYDGQQLPAFSADFDMLNIDDEAMVTDVRPDTLHFDIDADGTNVNLNCTRPIVKINYVYPSTDPYGQPITMSGTMLIPEEIWDGRTSSQGILLVNHYTKFHRDEAPTITNGELENIMLANPLYPNYIIVESDFYGFGATVRFQQAFLQGLVNARASLDGLMAARQLLDDMALDYGPLCFNIGYSSGGFDAMATLKLRDMEYADRITFDKTFAGGAPFDVCEAYRKFVQNDSTAYNAVPMLLMVCTNETQQLGMNYEDVFQPYISNRIDELILSKNYSAWPVCDSIGREKKIHEILLPPYCDLNSPQSMSMQQLFSKFSLTNEEWTPDTANRIYLFHSRADDYVPVESARPMIAFLKSKGFVPSIIPGKTNLQTNFVVNNMGHLSAITIYYIQTVAAIKAWPIMYTDGQLNPFYADMVSKDIDIVKTMRQLDAMGIDCRAIIRQIVALLTKKTDGEESGLAPQLDIITIVMMLSEQMNKLNLSLDDLYEMCEDSGIDIMKFLTDLIVYFGEQPVVDQEDDDDAEESTGSATRRAARLLNALNVNVTPADQYEQQLRNWMEENGVNLERPLK